LLKSLPDAHFVEHYDQIAIDPETPLVFFNPTDDPPNGVHLSTKGQLLTLSLLLRVHRSSFGGGCVP